MGFDLLCFSEQPLIKVIQGVVAEANDMFLDLTGYRREELYGQDMSKILNDLFRTTENFNFIDSEKTYIIFTKALEVRFVNIKRHIDCKDCTIYKFKEQENSRLDSKFLFINKLIEDDIIGIGIYTVPDFMLVKVNQTYINYLPSEFNSKETVYGKNLYEIMADFEGSYAEETFKNIIRTNKSIYITESQRLLPGGDNKYWDNTITPVSENGEVKFIVSMLQDVTERVLSREHIRIKNKQLEAVIDNLNDGVAIIDKGGFLIRANNTIRDLLDIKTSGGSFLSCIENKIESGCKYFNENGDEIGIDVIRSIPLLRGGNVKTYRVIEKNASEKKYLEFDGIPISDYNGEYTIGVIIVKDLTEHIKKNEEIERQNKKFQAIIECIGDIVTILDKNGNYLRRNSVLSNFFGTTYENFYEIAEKSEFYDIDGKILPTDEFCTARVLKGQKVKNQKCKMIKDKEEYYVSYSGVPIFDEHGDLEMGVMIAYDITEIIKTTKEIEKQKRLLETIIDNMHDGLVAINKDGKTIKVNKAFKETINKAFNVTASIKDVSQSQINGQKYFDDTGRELLPEEFPAMRVLRGEDVNQQRVMIKHGSNRVYVDFNGTPIFDENGKLELGIILRHDITDIIEKENKINEQQEMLYKSEKAQRETLEIALAMKDEFLSLISHEFRTPLNVISTAIQAMEYICADELSANTRKYLGMIRQNTFRQLRLVNNILDFTRINAGSIKVDRKNRDIVFLTRAITESVQAYASQKGVVLKFISALDKKIIGIDDEKYERILLNLLSNAIKFTQEGKSIVVTLNSIEGKIRVAVTDKGIGIPPDKLDIIFERFGQVDSSLSRQAEGTGIGLSLVKKFVEGLGGTIEVNSKLGEGTTFIILLKDEEINEEQSENEMADLLDNRLIQTTKVEFSDIYL